MLFSVLCVTAVVVTTLVVAVVLLTKQRRTPRRPSFIENYSGKTLGHRGCRDVGVPENSLSSFQYALEHGADGVECDIMYTQDGHIVVFHDAFVDRVLTGQGLVNDLTLAQLRALPFRHGLQQQTGAYHVPTLLELVDLCTKHQAKLMIEIKETRRVDQLLRDLVSMFAKHDLYASAFVASFNATHLWRLRKLDPRIATNLLFCPNLTKTYKEEKSPEMQFPVLLNWAIVHTLVDWILFNYALAIADHIGCDIVGPQNVAVSPRLITQARARGMVTSVWTVNSREESAHLRALGAMVTTDRVFPINPKLDSLLAAPLAVTALA